MENLPSQSDPLKATPSHKNSWWWLWSRSDSERDLWSLVFDNQVFVNSTDCGFQFITITENAKWPTDSPDNCFCQMSWAFVWCSAGRDKVLATSEKSSLSNNRTPLILAHQTTTDNHVLNVNWMFFKSWLCASPLLVLPPPPLLVKMHGQLD